MICGTCRVAETLGKDPEREKLRQEYILRYGEIVKIINSRLGKWNEYWDKLCGRIGANPNLEENTIEYDVYGQIIAAFERQVCAENNLKHPGSRIQMDVYSDKGNPMIIGFIDRNYDCRFWIDEWDFV